MKRILLCLQLGMLLVFGSACKKALEEDPKNSTYSGQFWRSASDVKSAIAGNYALLRDALTSGNFNNVPRHFLYGDAVPGNYFTIKVDGDGLQDVQNGNFTGRYNVEFYGDWTKYYKTIAMSNLVLKKVSAMQPGQLVDGTDPEIVRREALGQAYFIRALTYFMLVRTWGDVPLVLEAYDDPLNAPQLPRSDKAVVMAQIEKDCRSALENLTWIYRDPAQAKVTANQGSVYALLAHLYLWRATTSDLSTDQPRIGDVDAAQAAITALKTAGGYRQVDTANYNNTFVGKSSDGIFELAASEVNLEGSNTHIANFFLRKKYINYNSETFSRFFVPPSFLTAHFKRLPTGQVASVWVEGKWVWNEPAWAWEWHDGYWETTQLLADRITDIRYEKNFTDFNLSEPTCIKYHNVNYRTPTSAFISNNMIIFRYSDMLLLEAEIAVYKGNLTRAISIINASRKRNDALAVNGGLVPADANKATVLNEYMIERGRELYLEGHNYYDLIRTRQYSQFVPWLSVERFKQGGFYWPVAPELFKNNPNLKQTPYWLGKI